MKFESPQYFYWLFLLVPLLLLMVWERKQRQKSLKQLADPPTLLSEILPGYSSRREWMKNLLKILAVLLIILSLANPQWGTREEEVTLKGLNIFILADVSNSMLAQDIKPSRLERMKLKIKSLIEMGAGDRFGLIAFAGRSFLFSPLTMDQTTLENYVDDLNVDSIPVQGTDFAGALDLAIRSFPERDETKIVLIFTDGEDHSERLQSMLQELKKQKIKLYIVGVGTPEGAPVPEQGGGFKTFEGETVVSKLNEDFLKNLANQTGGYYQTFYPGDDRDIQEIYLNKIKGSNEEHEFKSSKKVIWESRFYWPLGMALALLLLERFIPDAFRKKNVS